MRMAIRTKPKRKNVLSSSAQKCIDRMLSELDADLNVERQKRAPKNRKLLRVNPKMKCLFDFIKCKLDAAATRK